MSQEMKNRINELRNFQAIITTKIFNKFGIDDKESVDEWGWFIDPEINYYKKQIVTQFSIPTTIQEEKSSINHFIVSNEQTATVTTSYYINIVKFITVLSLAYILLVL